MVKSEGKDVKNDNTSTIPCSKSYCIISTTTKNKDINKNSLLSQVVW